MPKPHPFNRAERFFSFKNKNVPISSRKKCARRRIFHVVEQNLSGAFFRAVYLYSNFSCCSRVPPDSCYYCYFIFVRTVWSCWQLNWRAILKQKRKEKCCVFLFPSLLSFQCPVRVKRFHSGDQHLFKFFGTKESVCWQNPTGLVWNTNMAAVTFFWITDIAIVTLCENEV